MRHFTFKVLKSQDPLQFKMTGSGQKPKQVWFGYDSLSLKISLKKKKSIV